MRDDGEDELGAGWPEDPPPEGCVWAILLVLGVVGLMYVYLFWTTRRPA